MADLSALEVVLTVCLSVIAHVSAAIWYTRRQRVYFEKRMDAMVKPIAEDVSTVKAWAAGDALPEVDLSPVTELTGILKGPLAVSLPPDFKSQIREAIVEYANGERAKTAAAMKAADGDAATAMLADMDNDLADLLAFAGVDAETKRKILAAGRYAQRLKDRHDRGEPLLQFGQLGSYG